MTGDNFFLERGISMIRDNDLVALWRMRFTF